MLMLAFDTSATLVSVAVLDEQKVWAFSQQEMERGHAEALMPMIEHVLKNAHVTLKDIQGIAVTLGPGSFTGIRVGLAAARAFALALGIKVYGVTCFEAWVYHLGRPVMVVLDTKRGDYYTQAFDEDGQAIGSASIQTGEELKKQLPFFAVGSAAEVLHEEIGCDVIQTISPVAVSVGRVALSRLDKPLPPEPIYLREADVTL